LGIGINQAALKIFQSYPVGNNNAISDNLNTIGYTFNAPQHVDQNTYIARLDYQVDQAGKHSLFWRGNLQNDSQNGTPQFPGMPPNSVSLANNKGFAVGWTGVLSPTKVNTFRYGLTRQGGETTGVLASVYTTFRGYTDRYGTTTDTARIVPVHTISDDLSWNHGAHDLRFGGVVRLVSNRSISYANAYSWATTNSSGISGSGADITPVSLSISSGDKTSYQYAMAAILGIVSQATGRYNYLVDGTVLPAGSPVKRNFVNRDGEMYAQDSWKLKPTLTVTYGLRLSLMAPVHEANGQQISTDVAIGDWFNQRGALADKGLATSTIAPITYVVANGPQGRPLYPFHTAAAPRVALAYSPKGENGISRFLFGNGRTSIRAWARACITTRSVNPGHALRLHRVRPFHKHHQSAERAGLDPVAAFHGLLDGAIIAYTRCAQGRLPRHVSQPVRHHQFHRRQLKGSLHHEPGFQRQPPVQPQDPGAGVVRGTAVAAFVDPARPGHAGQSTRPQERPNLLPGNDTTRHLHRSDGRRDGGVQRHCRRFEGAGHPVLRKHVGDGGRQRLHRHAGDCQRVPGAEHRGRLHQRAERHGQRVQL
jgi:hypothetical protein